MKTSSKYTVTRNACQQCNPLGASLVFRGIENSIPLLHGSQGCSTYIRRFMISHFKEPIDIASSNFSEDTTIFGGSSNLKTSITNIRKQYNPSFIGIASTCLSETIGDDVDMIIKEYNEEHSIEENCPDIITVSTPSYSGTQIDGFYNAVTAIIKSLSEGNGTGSHITILPGMLSPEDIRHLKDILYFYNIESTILPDYSETLDGPLWTQYEKISPGGTPLQEIYETGNSSHCIEFSNQTYITAGDILQEQHNVNLNRMPIPIGIKLTDNFFNTLCKISGKEIPLRYQQERGRLIDAYADAHKHAYGIKAILVGEEDLIISLISFLLECGIQPVLCATASTSGLIKSYIESINDILPQEPVILQGTDFGTIEDTAKGLHANIILSSSKGFKLSKNLNIPLVRIGFPIHDRIGGNRLLHIGYSGTMQLFDRIINSHVEHKQNISDVGYTYM